MHCSTGMCKYANITKSKFVIFGLVISSFNQTLVFDLRMGIAALILQPILKAVGSDGPF